MYEFNHHFDVLRTLAKDRGWSKQKVKSIRGQLINMSEPERKAYLQKIIASKK